MGENMKRFMMSVSDKMFDELERERKARRLETVQEVTRQLVADYLRRKDIATENVSEEERARTAILGPSKKH
jgi:metal-responsive CopG/Arc/MetJ family transcriptional regulator